MKDYSGKKVAGLITAAGKGTRLKPITDFVPKELIIYGTKPFLAYCLEAMKEIGVKDVFIIVGHNKGAILNYVKNGSYWGLNVRYLFQPYPKGLGDAVSQASSLASLYDAFFLLLGDNVIFPYSQLKEMIRFHIERNALMTVLVEKNREPEKYGVILPGAGNVIEEIHEKPSERKILDKLKIGDYYLAVSGAYVFHPSFFRYLERLTPGLRNEIQLTDAIAKSLATRETYYFLLKGKRVDIGTPEDYLKEQYEFFTTHSITSILNMKWGR